MCSNLRVIAQVLMQERATEKGAAKEDGALEATAGGDQAAGLHSEQFPGGGPQNATLIRV